MSKMRVVQVPRPRALLNSLSAKFPSPALDRSESRFKPVASATAIRSQKKEPGRASSIPGCPDTRSRESSMRWGGRRRVEPGQRVGVGWNGGYCGHCDPCRRGDFVACQTGQVPGITYDGGYAEYMIAPAGALARIPEELSAETRPR